jgi:hypothetical protein
MSALRRLERMSLPNWAFFPLALLVVAAMIAGALSQRDENAGLLLTDNGIEVSGTDLAAIVPGPGVQSRYDAQERAAYLTSDGSLQEFGARSAGAGFLLPETIERGVIGRTIRIEMEMRAADPSLTETRIGYFTVERGDSGWKRVRIGEEYRIVSFEHFIDPTTPVNDAEWVGVWPDIAGLGRGVLLRRISITILDEAEAS